MADIKIGKMTIGMCGTNTYYIYREDEKACIVVDPADTGEEIYEALSSRGYEVKAILLTHGHFDHIWGVNELKNKSGATVYASEDEADFLNDPHANMSDNFGRSYVVVPDVLLKDNDVINLCDIEIKMFKTPGHTVGGCCYYIEEAKMLIAGDTLFAESVGRTDFPGGSMSTLVRSINEKLMVLPDNVRVYPGHGGTTTIGYERENNPFL